MDHQLGSAGSDVAGVAFLLVESSRELLA